MVGIAQGLSTEESLKFANKISAKVVSQEDTKFMEENDGKN